MSVMCYFLVNFNVIIFNFVLLASSGGASSGGASNSVGGVGRGSDANPVAVGVVAGAAGRVARGVRNRNDASVESIEGWRQLACRNQRGGGARACRIQECYWAQPQG